LVRTGYYALYYSVHNESVRVLFGIILYFNLCYADS
jgi:hypothetical protein